MHTRIRILMTMAFAASPHSLFITQLLFAPAICVQMHAGASEKFIESVTFDDSSGSRFDDTSGFDDKASRKLDEESDGMFHHGKSQSRVTVYDTAEWLALGEMNKLGVTRYKSNAIIRKKRKDGNFFWADSVNRDGANRYSGAKDLTESVSWGWHHPSSLYGTIPVGSPLIDDVMNIYLASDDAIRKFDVSGNIMWSYAPRGQLAAAPTLSTGCSSRLSATAVFDISAEEEEALRPDWIKGNGSDAEHRAKFFRDFKVGDLVKVKAGASYRADGRELYTAGDQGLISGVVPDGEGGYGRAVIEWTRTGRKSAVEFDAIQNHFVRVESARCTPMLIGSTTSGYVFAIELSTGYEVWALQGSSTIAGVKGALASKSGIVVVATNRCTDRYCYRYRNQTNVLTPGNTVVRGLNPANGVEVWSFVPEAPVWNMNPVWGPDNTVIFNDQEGSVYCLQLSTGSQLWKGDGKLGTYTEAAAVYDAGNNMVFGLGMLQYDAHLTHRAHNTGLDVGCNPYVAPGILPRCGNAAFKQGFVRAYNATSGRLQWEKVTPQPPASAVTGGLNTPRFHTRLVVTLGHNCARNSPTEILIMDPVSGHSFSMDGPTLWSGMCAGDKEGGDIRRAMGGRAVCSPGSWSAPVVDGDGDVYVGNQVGVYQRWGAPTGYGTGRRDFQLLSSLVTGVAFQDSATALADGLMAVATCTSLIVFQTANFSDEFANTTWTFPPHGYTPDFNASSAGYSR
ncbi:unnamed protein product [Prorocentrum cordatum]|uniref:Pyrrolo-quinoline quinone repeat domain-containing protein n=1 Tax=Prorocentrum cordatum TaxID=2364126 RepID=A0ABN9SJN1_9DINO|nr:unnamed protein product [Polarella glacialis]